MKAITEKAAHHFIDLGCSLDAPVITWPNPHDFHRVLKEVSMASRLLDRANERPDWIEPRLMRLILNGSSLTAVEHGRALLARTVLYQTVRKFFGDVDLLLTPTVPVAAWSVEPGPEEGPKEIDGKPAPTMFDRIPFTYPFTLSGQPAATVPCGFTAVGLPVGLQIVGRWHADAVVLRAAAGFEAIQPWATHRPPLNADNW